LRKPHSPYTSRPEKTVGPSSKKSRCVTPQKFHMEGKIPQNFNLYGHWKQGEREKRGKLKVASKGGGGHGGGLKIRKGKVHKKESNPT